MNPFLITFLPLLSTYVRDQLCIGGLILSFLILGYIYLYCHQDSGGGTYTGGHYDHQAPRRHSRQPREDKQRSDQEGYRRGMEDAIFGDSYHYTRGVSGSENYRNGYTRGYEENCYHDEDW